MNPSAVRGVCACALSLVLGVGFSSRLVADQADEAFAAKLEARGYYDLLELQYKDWLSNESLSSEERVQKAHGLIALYTRMAERSADQRDRKKYQQLATQRMEQLRKQVIPPSLMIQLDMNEAQLLLDEVRTMGTVGPPVVNDEGETKPSPVEQAWDKVLALYTKVSKEASASLEDLLRSKKKDVEAQTRLEGLLLDSGLRGAWARYYFSLALPAANERRAKVLKQANGTFEMTAISYPDKDLKYECYLGCALCAKEIGNKQKAMGMFDDVAKNGTNPNIRRLALYNKAQMFFDAKQYEEALGAAAGAVSEVSRTPDVEVERAALYLKAKAGFAVAARKQGGEADKIRAEAEKAATTLASAGGRYGPMAQELLITAGGGGGSGAASFQALASADKLNEQQKWSEAAAAYEAFLAGKPAGASKSLLADAQLKMGLCYYRLKAYAKSADAFKAVMDLSGDPSRAARAGYYMAATRGLAAMESGKEEDRAAYVDALTVVEKRYPTHEEIDNIEFRLGAVLEAARKYTEAAQKYRKVREGAKDYREAQLRAGICDTILLAESWQKKAPESETKPLLASAVKSLKAADAPVSEGDAAGQKVAADAAVRLARIYMSGGVMKPEEALSSLKDYEKKYPEQAGGIGDALFLRFWAYEKLGKLEEALNTLREAVAKEPQNPQIPPAFETLAVDCDDAAQKSTGPKAQELRENAIALLDSYLTQFGPSAGQEAYERLLMRRARLSAQAGKWDKAVADYGILYERHKDALNINKELANAYSQQGNYARALELYQSLEDGTERYTPDWWQARYNVALMFYKMNDMDRMVRVIMSVFIFREDLGGPEVKKKFDELILKCIEQMKGYQETAKGAQLYSPQWWQAVYNMALGFNKAGDQGKMNSLIDGLRILQSDLGGADLKKKFDALQGLTERR